MTDPTPEQPLVFDRSGIQSVDRAAVEEFGIPGVVLMENASLGLAMAAMSLIGGEPPATVLIVCGPGNNGGDGYALARHLHNEGLDVVLAPVGKPKKGSDAAINATIAERMGLALIDAAGRDDLEELDLIVDAIFGTGLTGEVDGEAAEWIEWMNDQEALIMSVDVPSGLDCDTGSPLGVAVCADCTVTFVGIKQGFASDEAGEYLGDVAITDIGAPVELYRRFAID